MRRIARWEVYALYLLLPTPHHYTHYSRDTPHLWGSGMHSRQSRTVGIFLGPPAIRSNTSHASKGFYYIIFYSTYGAACYVFAHDWWRSQSMVFANCRSVLCYSRTLNLTHTHGVGRAIPIASLSLLVSYTIIGNILCRLE